MWQSTARSYIPLAADGKAGCNHELTTEICFLCPGIGSGVVFPDVFKIVKGAATTINTSSYISLGADGKTYRPKS